MNSARNRSLTDTERHLAQWMLEHGTRAAKQYLAQLDLAEVTPWKCPCGCASINFQMKGHTEPPPGVHILGDFLVGEGDHQSGIFIFSSGGLLRGIEVYGLAGGAPHVLPPPEQLRAFEATGTSIPSPQGREEKNS
jgi:hypothetical protein